MSNFLEEIENEFSRGRGRQSYLAPLDWDLVQSWDNRGVPLSLVLRSMGEVFKQNTAKHRPEKINSLRYFTPAVEKAFAEWQTSQVGKSNSESTQYIATQKTNIMQNSSFAAAVADLDKNIEILDLIQTLLMPETLSTKFYLLPDLLITAIAKTRREILALVDDCRSKQLCSDKIEARLTELRAELEISLILSVSEDERAKIIADVKTEYGKFHLMDGVQQKVLIRKLYNRFGLPEITLYEL